MLKLCTPRQLLLCFTTGVFFVFSSVASAGESTIGSSLDHDQAKSVQLDVDAMTQAAEQAYTSRTGGESALDRGLVDQKSFFDKIVTFLSGNGSNFSTYNLGGTVPPHHAPSVDYAQNPYARRLNTETDDLERTVPTTSDFNWADSSKRHPGFDVDAYYAKDATPAKPATSPKRGRTYSFKPGVLSPTQGSHTSQSSSTGAGSAASSAGTDAFAPYSSAPLFNSMSRTAATSYSAPAHNAPAQGENNEAEVEDTPPAPSAPAARSYHQWMVGWTKSGVWAPTASNSGTWNSTSAFWRWEEDLDYADEPYFLNVHNAVFKQTYNGVTANINVALNSGIRAANVVVENGNYIFDGGAFLQANKTGASPEVYTLTLTNSQTTITQANEAFNGEVYIDAASKLMMKHISSVGTGSISVASGGTLELNGITGGIGMAATFANSLSGGGSLSVSGGSLIRINQVNVGFTGLVTIDATSTLTLEGVASTTGSLFNLAGLTNSGIVTFDLTGSTLGLGNYTLLTTTSAISGTGSFAWTGVTMDSNYNYALTRTDHSVTLAVTSIIAPPVVPPNPATPFVGLRLTWMITNGTWNQAAGQHNNRFVWEAGWRPNPTSPGSWWYDNDDNLDGYDMLFTYSRRDGSNPTHSVTVAAAGVTPRNVSVEDDNYAFSGGSFLGSNTTFLSIKNSNTTINMANSGFATQVYLGAGGNLTLGHVNSLGTARIDIVGGSLDLNTLAVANNISYYGGTLLRYSNYTGAMTLNANWTQTMAMAAAATVKTNVGTTYNLGGMSTAHNITYNGGILSGYNNYTGRVTVKTDGLTLNNAFHGSATVDTSTTLILEGLASTTGSLFSLAGLTNSGIVTFDLTGSTLGLGNYTLLTTTSTISGTGSFAWTGVTMDSNYNYALTRTSNSVTLEITSVYTPPVVPPNPADAAGVWGMRDTWTRGSGTWNNTPAGSGTLTNPAAGYWVWEESWWTSPVLLGVKPNQTINPNPDPTPKAQPWWYDSEKTAGNHLLFTDTLATKNTYTITVAADVLSTQYSIVGPKSVSVEDDNYTFTGASFLGAGAQFLSIKNSNTTINMANSGFATQVYLGAGGNLTLGHVNSLGTARIDIVGGSLDLNNLAISNNIAYWGGSLLRYGNYTGRVTVATNGLRLNNSFTASATVNTGTTLTLEGVLSSGSLFALAGLTNNGTVMFDLTGSTFVADHTYILLTTTTAISGTGAFDWTGVTRLDNYEYNLIVTANSVSLEVTTIDLPEHTHLAWVKESGTWDTSSDNWNWEDTPYLEEAFKDGDGVLFGTQATERTIAVIAGGVAPSHVCIEGGDYIFTGGSFLGADTAYLSITSSSTTINSANASFAGYVNLEAGGSLTLGDINSLGTASINLVGGTLDLNDLAVTNSIMYHGGSLSNYGSYTGLVTVEANGLCLDNSFAASVTVNNDTTLILAGEVVGTGSLFALVDLENNGIVMFDLSGSIFEVDTIYTLLTTTGLITGSGSFDWTGVARQNGWNYSLLHTGTSVELHITSIEYTHDPADDLRGERFTWVFGSGEWHQATNSHNGQFSWEEAWWTTSFRNPPVNSSPKPIAQWTYDNAQRTDGCNLLFTNPLVDKGTIYEIEVMGVSSPQSVCIEDDNYKFIGASFLSAATSFLSLKNTDTTITQANAGFDGVVYIGEEARLRLTETASTLVDNLGTASVYIAYGGTLVFDDINNDNATLRFNNSISGVGHIDVVNESTIRMTGNNSGFSGTVFIDGYSRISVNSVDGMGTAKITIQNSPGSTSDLNKLLWGAFSYNSCTGVSTNEFAGDGLISIRQQRNPAPGQDLFSTITFEKANPNFNGEIYIEGGELDFETEEVINFSTATFKHLGAAGGVSLGSGVADTHYIYNAGRVIIDITADDNGKTVAENGGPGRATWTTNIEGFWTSECIIKAGHDLYVDITTVNKKTGDNWDEDSLPGGKRISQAYLTMEMAAKVEAATGNTISVNYLHMAQDSVLYLQDGAHLELRGDFQWNPQNWGPVQHHVDGMIVLNRGSSIIFTGDYFGSENIMSGLNNDVQGTIRMEASQKDWTAVASEWIEKAPPSLGYYGEKLGEFDLRHYFDRQIDDHYPGADIPTLSINDMNLEFFFTGFDGGGMSYLAFLQTYCPSFEYGNEPAGCYVSFLLDSVGLTWFGNTEAMHIDEWGKYWSFENGVVHYYYNTPPWYLIPEPTTATLGMLGLAGLLLRRRRRRK